MNLAPVLLFTFNRLDHTKKTIEALQKNILAKDSEIFIFSDGPRNIEEEEEVNKVRDYIKGIDGFKKINIIESENNKGLAKSIIEGVSKVINEYGKVIVLEDDLVTTEYFLEYMNDAINTYSHRMDIWSISGYTPKIKIPDYYKDNIYLTRRGCSWGWATWKDRWILNDWEIKDYNDFKVDKVKIKEFNQMGNDMTPMLKDQMEGRINSWAIRWGYNQFKQNLWTVYPVKSFVKNIGTDLSGTHSSITNKYETEMAEKNMELNLDVQVNLNIIKNFKNFNDLTFSGYAGLIIKKIGLYKPARKLRNYILRLIKI